MNFYYQSLINTVERIWFDVGAHERAMYTREPLDDQENLAVIAFEPMFDKWGTLAAQYFHERLFPLPAAVSSKFVLSNPKMLNGAPPLTRMHFVSERDI
jgi:hypothetical protein